MDLKVQLMFVSCAVRHQPEAPGRKSMKTKGPKAPRSGGGGNLPSTNPPVQGCVANAKGPSAQMVGFQGPKTPLDYGFWDPKTLLLGDSDPVAKELKGRSFVYFCP